MQMKGLVFSLILLTQACGPLLAQMSAPAQPDPPGILQRLLEKAREANAQVQDYGSAAMGFFGAYYEDHIQPVTTSYTEWASNVTSSVTGKIQATIDNYMPSKSK